MSYTFFSLTTYYFCILVIFDAMPTISANLSNFPGLYEEILELRQNFKSYEFPKNNDEYFTDCGYEPINYGSFDFIIVGGGTAGGVLANRLTEEKFSVLLVEAGPSEPETTSLIGLAGYFFKSKWSWGYNTTPKNNACLGSTNQQCYYPKGKMLGGSSCLNAGMYSRGHPKDYDKWEALGNIGWSYKDVLPYFKKAENAMFTAHVEPSYHGFYGPQGVDIPEDTPRLTSALIDIFKELGEKESDYNGETPYGIGRIQEFLNINIRASTAQAYITPAKSRRNLYITTNALVTKIDFSGNRAVGIKFVKNGQVYQANASKEIIVSAGAVNTPQLLMLSGIGPADELRKHNIEIIKKLPVGKYLQDHIYYTLFYRTNHVYYNITLEEQLKLWYQNKRPLVTGMGSQVVNYFNLQNDTNSQPDIEAMIVGPPAASEWGKTLRYNKKYTDMFENLNPYTDVMIFVTILHPKSKGEVTLKSNNPRDFPLINTNFFSEKSDIDVLYHGIKRVLKVSDSETYKNFQFQQLDFPIPDCDRMYPKLSKKWWYCAIKYLSTTIHHSIGTARMGVSPEDSVVNSELKVHGTEGLRIVDASVIPSQISGHTNAPVVMISEKISDVIKKSYIVIGQK